MSVLGSHFTALKLYEGMGGLRISCHLQDMIFWDEMPHSLGTYVSEELASFIFCLKGEGSGFLQNVKNDIKWFDFWDFDDTFATEIKVM